MKVIGGLPVLTLIVSAFTGGALILASCQSGESGEQGTADVAPVEKPHADVTEAKGEGEAKPADPDLSDKVLADGSHSVFGLKMPRGMMPIKVPGNVHRFEGTHSLTVLRRYLVNQLQPPVEVKDDGVGGTHIRNARVLAADKENDIRISIRMFNGSLGGGSVDVSKEREGFGDEGAVSGSPASLPEYTGDGSGRKLTAHNQLQIPPPPRNKAERKKRMWEMMQKVQRGKKLTPGDMENEYFY